MLRLPRKVYTVSLPGVEPGVSIARDGAEVELTELGRDRFSIAIRKGIERVVAVQAFNAEGKELRISNPSLEHSNVGWTGDFEVHGKPTRFDVKLAGELKRLEYGFRLKLPEPVPASSSD